MTTRLTKSTGAAARLRELLGSGETIIAPGAFDPLAARCVEAAEVRTAEQRYAPSSQPEDGS